MCGPAGCQQQLPDSTGSQYDSLVLGWAVRIGTALNLSTDRAQVVMNEILFIIKQVFSL